MAFPITEASLAMPRAVYLINEVDEFGPMHIAVSDGNMDDSHLDFIQREMDAKGATNLEHELMKLLRSMSVEQREQAWEYAEQGYLPVLNHQGTIDIRLHPKR